MTYLDDEIMVVRDESGAPEVLVKEMSQVQVPKMVEARRAGCRAVVAFELAFMHPSRA